MPVYIDKFKPTFIKCALKYDTIFLQPGVWEQFLSLHKDNNMIISNL